MTDQTKDLEEQLTKMAASLRSKEQELKEMNIHLMGANARTELVKGMIRAVIRTMPKTPIAKKLESGLKTVDKLATARQSEFEDDARKLAEAVFAVFTKHEGVLISSEDWEALAPVAQRILRDPYRSRHWDGEGEHDQRIQTS